MRVSWHLVLCNFANWLRFSLPIFGRSSMYSSHLTNWWKFFWEVIPKSLPYLQHLRCVLELIIMRCLTVHFHFSKSWTSSNNYAWGNVSVLEFVLCYLSTETSDWTILWFHLMRSLCVNTLTLHGHPLTFVELRVILMTRVVECWNLWPSVYLDEEATFSSRDSVPCRSFFMSMFLATGWHLH